MATAHTEVRMKTTPGVAPRNSRRNEIVAITLFAVSALLALCLVSYSPNDASTSIDNPENYQRRLRSTPLGRLQTPEDIARAFLFVVSDEAAMITGSMITVDGGSAL